jgi:hypothetical protein
VSLVGVVSRVKKAEECVSLGFVWICDFAGDITNFLWGVFSAALLTILFMFVPMVFRILARWEGTILRTHAELSIMNRVFAFKVIVRSSRTIPYDVLLTRVVEQPFTSHTLDWPSFCSLLRH